MMTAASGAAAASAKPADDAAMGMDVDPPNGRVHDDALLAAGSFRVPRRDLLRLLIDELRALGCPQAAAALEREAGVALEDPHVREFRAAVLRGDWAAAHAAVDGLVPAPQRAAAMFHLWEQQYLELLEVQDTVGALEILRNRLAPLHHDPMRLAELSCLLMCTDPQDLRTRARWAGRAGGSRADVLRKIQATGVIPATVMVRERRLETLVAQALQHQADRCTFHNAAVVDALPHHGRFLYADHVCDAAQNFPTRLGHTFRDLDDEVWFVAFAHAGDRVAGASKNGVTVIWDVRTRQMVCRLSKHDDAVAFLAWSPDDSRILTCSNDSKMRMWNTTTGTCVYTCSAHGEGVTAAGWLPDGKRFVSGSLDKSLCLWTETGTLVHKWTGTRIIDFQVAHDGSMVVVATNNQVHIYDLNTFEELGSFEEIDAITSIALTRDGRLALTNTTCQELHLWELTKVPAPASNGVSASSSAAHSRSATAGPQPAMPLSPLAPLMSITSMVASTLASTIGATSPASPASPQPARAPYRIQSKLLHKYTGHSQGKFVIRSTFGGAGESFIVSGSEDAKAYIWHRDTTARLAVLEGHSATVNSVAWNPAVPGMVATASDDCTVRIWVPEAGLEA